MEPISHSPKRERIVALDLLRGWFLVIIIIDHLLFFPSLFEFISGRGMLWASAAEGFFIISGMLVGYVYGPRMLAAPRQATQRILKRAGVLYLVSIGLTYLFVWWGHLARHSYLKSGLWLNPPLREFLYKTLTLQYSYGWADFLQYYVVFLMAAPLILYLCTKRLAWPVLAVSLELWLLRNKNFDLAWQFIFTIGVLVGYYLPAIENRVRQLTHRQQVLGRRLLYGLTFATVALSAMTVRGTGIFRNQQAAGRHFPLWSIHVHNFFEHFLAITSPLVDKWTLAPLRLVIALLWFTSLYIFFRRHEALIQRLSHGLLKTLGQQSLFVYGLHSVVIFAVLIIWPHSVGFVRNSLYTGLVIGLIYSITRYRHHVKTWLGNCWHGLPSTRLPKRIQEET